MTEMYHGKAGELDLHVGLCLTEDIDAAAEYARYGYAAGQDRLVHTVELDLAGLAVVEVDGYDRDENTAAGDDHAEIAGADVIVYADETIRGDAHTTWRLMSPSALAAVRIIGTTDAEEL